MQEDKHRKRADALFGQIALRLNIVTRAQLDEALELQRFADGHRALGLILCDLKYVSDSDLQRILDAQKALLTQQAGREKALREDNLFGKVAIRLGYCTEEQVVECLALQEQLPPDRFMRLGDVMVIKGCLTVEQVKKTVDTQKGLIVYCPKCDTQFNVVMFRPGVSLQCYRCGTPLRIPLRTSTQTLDEAIYFGEE